MIESMFVIHITNLQYSRAQDLSQWSIIYRNDYNVPSHSLGATHSFLSSSITVPSGHSHPLAIQTAGQTIGSWVLLHVWWQSGCEAHSFLTCPSTGQTVIKITSLMHYCKQVDVTCKLCHYYSMATHTLMQKNFNVKKIWLSKVESVL